MKKGLLVMVISILFITGCSLLKPKYDYLVLVNKYSKLPDDWEKNVKLVTVTNANNEKIKIEKEAYEQYKKLKKDVQKDGVTIDLDSVYRSVSEQQKLWDDWTKEKGIDYVKKYVAVPGYSEHHTGLAVDICLIKDGKRVNDNDDMIADRKSFKIIHKKLADYGFILRYLEGRKDKTGYDYEPWHLRYIGNKKIAKEIMDKDITFEEYLDSVKDLKGNPSAAKYHIEKALKEYFKDIYKDKIEDARFNVKKLYNGDEDETIKDLKLGEKDIAFAVEYQVKPTKDSYIKELTLPNGEYDKELGWVKGLQRVGVLKYDEKSKSYSIKEFGSGF